LEEVEEEASAALAVGLLVAAEQAEAGREFKVQHPKFKIQSSKLKLIIN
jgi:hypothetical protein